MANKRMFSMDIVSSDAFLDMPASSRELYFQLGMYADDEGFVNPKKVMRLTGASGDDIKVLVGKRFVLPFKSGVVVIKHWLIHNTIRMDRFAPTQYQEEKKELITKKNKAYTELATKRQPSGNQMVPQVKLSKVKISKDKLVNTATEVAGVKDIFKLFYQSINPTINFGNTNQRKSAQTLIETVGLEKAINATKFAISIQGTKYAPTITTPTQLLNKYGELQGYYKKNNNSNVITI